jgi:HSP20 family protein
MSGDEITNPADGRARESRTSYQLNHKLSVESGGDRMMMRWSDPFAEAFSLRDAMNRLFNEAVIRPGAFVGGGSPFPVAVLEREGHYYVKALLPGLIPENVDITAQGNTITLKGTLAAPFAENELNQGTLLVDEIGTGTFSRSLTLPKDVATDRIEANYDYGVLTLTVPIAEHAQIKRISVKAQPQLVEANQ